MTTPPIDDADIARKSEEDPYAHKEARSKLYSPTNEESKNVAPLSTEVIRQSAGTTTMKNITNHSIRQSDSGPIKRGSLGVSPDHQLR
jgi:hypothetical protein